MTQHPPAGWFPDPSTPGSMRWWDGTAWSEHVTPAAPAAAAAATASEPAAHVGAPHVVGGGPEQHQQQLSAEPAAAPAGASMLARLGGATTVFGRGGQAPRIIGVVVAAVVAIAVGIAFHSTADVKLSHEFTTPDGVLSVSMPAKPEHRQETKQEDGASITVDMYMSDLGRDRGGIMVGYADYNTLLASLTPAQKVMARKLMTPELILGEAAAGAAEQSNSTLESKKFATISGQRALELRLRPNDGRGVGEAILFYDQKKAVFYMVVVVTRDGDEKLLARVRDTIAFAA